MILVIAATELEMGCLLRQGGKGGPWDLLVTGVGLASTSLKLTRYLSKRGDEITGVVNFGVGGAYYQGDDNGDQLQLLDICVATREAFGDLGICVGDRVQYLPPDITGPLEIGLEGDFSRRCEKGLDNNEIPYLKGGFVSVNAASGRRARGEMLQKKFCGICENMEGAAAAQVCADFSLPFFEIRCISNMVEDRNPENWRLQEACSKISGITLKMLKEITGA